MSQSTASLQTERQPAPSTMPAWKTELNAKLEAHRRRRGPAEPITGPETASRARDAVSERDGGAGRAMASRVAARVAERYAHAPSYSEVLAARAAAAAAAADAGADAVKQAHAAAQDLLSSLAGPGWRHDEADSEGDEGGAVDGLMDSAEAAESTDSPESSHWRQAEHVGWQGRAAVEHPEPLPARAAMPPRAAAASGAGGSSARSIVDAFAEAEVPAATSLPAKLIEFPRELVATQRARPRLAEGPLAEEEEAGLLPLRIFEVHGQAGVQGRSPDEGGASNGDADPAALQAARSMPGEPKGDERGRRLYQGEPVPGWDSGFLSERQAEAPGWQSIRLGEHPRSGQEELTLQHRGRAGEAQAQRAPAQHAPAQQAPALFLAPLSDRAMAALVDLGLVAGGFLLFVLTFAACTTHPPTGRMALLSCGVVFAALAVFYQWLFLSYGAGTPGMRYARIALCTFDDNNPTRAMLRSRVWAGVLVALPLGLGLLWALLDEDSLGWHDRLTGTYQRSY